MKKRILSLILTVILVVGMIPTGVFADKTPHEKCHEHDLEATEVVQEIIEETEDDTSLVEDDESLETTAETKLSVDNVDCSSETLLSDDMSCGENFTYEITDGVLRITGTGAMPDYKSFKDLPYYGIYSEIKAVVIDDGITSIGDHAFSGCSSLTSVTIPDSVTSIGDTAFSACSSLTSVTIPDSVVSIGGSAFSDCSSLTSVTIPGSITSFGNSVFARCNSLESVTVDDGVEIIGYYAFSECSSLASVTIPDSVTKISSFAFSGCSSLASVTIPDSVTKIGSSAFYGCSRLTSITIPDSVTSIGSLAFYKCIPLREVIFEGNAPTIGVNAFSYCAVDYFYYPCDGEGWGEIHYSNMTKYHTELSEPEEVLPTCTEEGYIGTRCAGCGDQFRENVVPAVGHTEIISVAKSATCTEDGFTEGKYCSVCNAVLISQDMIPSTGHAYDKGVVTKAPTCETTGVKVYTCQNDKSHTYAEAVLATGHNYIDGRCQSCGYDISHGNVVVSGSCGDSVNYTLYESGRMEITGTGEIDYQFKLSDKYLDIVNVFIGDGVTGVGEYAFAECVNLTSVEIPDTVNSIGDYAFKGCVKLKNITFPESVVTIGGYLFSECLSLKSVTILNPTATVSLYLLFESEDVCVKGYTCSDAHKAVLYASGYIWAGSFESIGECYVDNIWVSGDCGEDLSWTLNVNGTLTISGQGVMPDYGNVSNKAPWYMYRDCISVITIDNGVLSIGTQAFYACANLQRVYLPESLIKVAGSAFYHSSYNFDVYIESMEMWYNLVRETDVVDMFGRYNLYLQDRLVENLVIPGNVEEVPRYAFSFCKSIKSLVVSYGVTSIDSVAFYECSNLESVVLQNGLINIGESAFNYCGKLTSVIIPGSVSTIGDYAFNCDYLAEVYYGGSIDKWNSLNVEIPNAQYIHYLTNDSSEHWWFNSIDATCTEDGYTCESCSCGYERNKVTVSATGHTEGEPVTENRVEPICEVKGSYDTVVYCTICDDEISRETTTIPATDHAYDNGVVTTLPGCETTGIKTFTCQNDKSHTYTEVIPATGHTKGAVVIENRTDPDCSNEGSYDEVIYCTVCGEEISREKKSIDILPHEIVTDPAIAPTCTSLGCTEGSHCSVCGTVIVAQRIVPSTGHTEIKDVAVEATCTTTGLTEGSHCYICGVTLVPREVVPAKGHAYYETVTTAPTCETAGIKTYICQNDKSHFYTEIIPATGHNPYTDPVVPPTCTEDGMTEGTRCLTCNKVLAPPTLIPATGHNHVKGECTRCGDTITYVEAPKLKSTNVESTGKNKLTWNKVNGAVKYQIYRSTSKSSGYKSQRIVTGTSWADANAKAGTRYYYYAVAIAKDDTKSEKSNIINRVCDLARPTVTLTNVASTGKIKVSWKKVDGAVKYQIYRSTTKNGTYKAQATVKTLNWTDPNSTAGKTYYYKVKAIHKNSNANSALTSYKSRMADLKSPVVKITASSGKPKVSWAAVTNAKQYKIYRSTSKNGTYKLVHTTTSKSWKDTTAKKGKTYYYKVIAVHKNTNANSAYSTVVSKKCTK